MTYKPNRWDMLLDVVIMFAGGLQVAMGITLQNDDPLFRILLIAAGMVVFGTAVSKSVTDFYYVNIKSREMVQPPKMGHGPITTPATPKPPIQNHSPGK